MCLACVYQWIELWFHYLVSQKSEIWTNLPILGIKLWILPNFWYPLIKVCYMQQLCSWYFQNKQELESRIVNVFIFWIKKWQIELFSVHIYLELWRSQWSASTRTWFRGICHVVNCKKVSWFFNFCQLFQSKSSLFLKTWVWKLCLYLCCTFSKCHRLFSCFGGAWAYFG